MGVSIREYARQRGVSDTAVRKALKQGRITAEPDGTIDVDRADREWSSNTAKPQTKQAAKTKPVPAAAVEAVEDTLKESGSPVGDDWEERTHILENFTVDETRVRITITGNPLYRPRLRALRVIIT